MATARWGALVITSAAILGGVDVRSAAHERPRVELHLIDRVGVPAEDLGRARATVERVFKAAGVDIAWGEGTASAFVGSTTVGAGRPRRVAVVIVNSGSDATRGATGCVLGVAAAALGRASVFFNRIVEMSETRPVDLPIVLARVITHEVGHLLLPPGSHSPYGIMRADLDMGYANPGHFTDDQARTIRDALTGG